MQEAGTRTERVPSRSWYLLKLLVGLCLSPDSKVCDVDGGRASDIGTDSRQKLDSVTGAHHLATTRRDTAIHEKPIESDALIAQRIALVDADDRRWQTLDVLAGREAGPGERVAGVKGLDAVGHGGAVVPEVKYDLPSQQTYSAFSPDYVRPSLRSGFTV